MATATPRVFILPATTSSTSDSSKAGTSTAEHSILTFNHPATDVPTRYLIHHPSSPSSSSTSSTKDSSNNNSNNSNDGGAFIYEILKVANPAHSPRSWLIAPDSAPLSLNPQSQSQSQSEPQNQKTTPEKEQPNPSEKEDDKSSLIIKDAHLYLTTPLDPLYLLLPHLSSPKTSRNFLSLDDLLESHPQSAQWNTIFSLHPNSQRLLRTRLLLVCDTVSTGGEDDDDEKMYRINEDKLYKLLISRVEAVAKALPGSITTYITKKLSKPIGTQVSTAWKRQSESTKTNTKSGGIINDSHLENDDEEGEGEDPQEDPAVDSQLRREASKLNLQDTPAAAEGQEGKGEDETMIIEDEITTTSHLPPPEIQYLSHLSHSLQFLQPYLPASISTTLSTKLFTLHPQEPLEKYLEELKALKAAANAALDFSMSHSKRTLEDLEAGGGGTSKENMERERKRKKKEEDAKKSTAVKKLEKVDTKGMMKMTAFFKKKDAK
ncbi:hypothetical protein TWF730_009854 [Orbilia blumenaviensis]|uniref:Ribonuclease H2 subunit B n=1 Tax=Orbilia blumenaviensis TaxID=1796055 RepID=A0AAV9USZ3_9PEZI